MHEQFWRAAQALRSGARGDMKVDAYAVMVEAALTSSSAALRYRARDILRGAGVVVLDAHDTDASRPLYANT